jgi:hypothetical protein
VRDALRANDDDDDGDDGDDDGDGDDDEPPRRCPVGTLIMKCDVNIKMHLREICF